MSPAPPASVAVEPNPAPTPAAIFDVAGLDRLVASLIDLGYVVIAPQRRDGVIALGPVASAAELPAGWGDDQHPARYRLRRREDNRRFGYAVGPTSPKHFLFPPREEVAAAARDSTGAWTAVTIEPPQTRYAFVGVRPCELASILVQDRVLLAPGREDPGYARRRRAAFVVVVNCGTPASTCFCSSFGTGPKVDQDGFDLALTEITDGGEPRFVVEIGSDRGANLLATIDADEATTDDLAAATTEIDAAVSVMSRAGARTIDPTDVHEILLRDPVHPAWDDVAERCLLCANCTMACPTCFCHTVEDTQDLTGDHADRWRVWDSCFNPGFSELGGQPWRASGTARYRQWLTHKFATWQDQFGELGCVGCGRCIAWCPAGIDLTSEVAALRIPTEGSRP